MFIPPYNYIHGIGSEEEFLHTYIHNSFVPVWTATCIKLFLTLVIFIIKVYTLRRLN